MTNEMMAVSNVGVPALCSIQATDRKTASRLFNAVNNPEHRIGDFINKKIKVKDVLIEPIELTDEETGEIKTCPRVVLVDDKGKAYQAVSVGIANSVLSLIKCFGEPTWDEPLEVEVKQVPTKNGSMLTLATDY